MGAGLDLFALRLSGRPLTNELGPLVMIDQPRAFPLSHTVSKWRRSPASKHVENSLSASFQHNLNMPRSY